MAARIARERGAKPLRSVSGKAVSETARLYDFRFRALLGADNWAALPAEVQARFSKRLKVGESENYSGQIMDCRMNLWGRILVQLCRVIGAPLPLERNSGTAATVSVTEEGGSNGEGGGQHWTRIYARRRGFPQVICSAKRFSGRTGLEEYISRRIGVALRIEPVKRGIRFVGDEYFVKLSGRRWKIPRWLAPGRLTVDHRDLGKGKFEFTLELLHPLFGLLIRQSCHFRDVPVSNEMALASE